MEEDVKTRFKWKFYHLTIELNIIILLVAMSIMFFFIFHSPYSIPIIMGMLIVAFILSLDFFKKYKATKKWLDEQPEKEKNDNDTRQNGTI
jgi:Ca2+/Na+ antiporter